jgi:hypothetical protein
MTSNSWAGASDSSVGCTETRRMSSPWSWMPSPTTSPGDRTSPLNEDATEERLVELAFSEGWFVVLQGWEAEGPGRETGDEVYVGDAGEDGE